MRLWCLLERSSSQSTGMQERKRCKKDEVLKGSTSDVAIFQAVTRSCDDGVPVWRWSIGIRRPVH